MHVKYSKPMYQTKPIIPRGVTDTIPLPKNMYTMRNIHANNGCTEKGSDHVSSLPSVTNKSGNITQQKLENPTEMNTLLDRQHKILLQLDDLRQQMISLKTELSSSSQPIVAKVLQSTFACPLEVGNFPEIIINASPTNPPYSLQLIQKLCKNVFHLQVTTHTHSSLSSHDSVKQFLPSATIIHKPTIQLRLIWKNVGPNTELILTENTIVGEVNILRYFSRMIPNILKYETLDNYYEIDAILDLCHFCLISKSKAEVSKLLHTLTNKLGKNNWLCGVTNISIADIAAFSLLKQSGCSELPQNLSKWFKRCEAVA